MSGKRARQRRQHAPPDAGAVEILWDNGRWVRLEDASARTGIARPTTQAFLDYCLMRGYVREATGPEPHAHPAFRAGKRLWCRTPGATLLLHVLGAPPDTPVPAEWRTLRWDTWPDAS